MSTLPFLAIATPAVFGPAYFREIGAVLAASAGGPPDLAALGAVMCRHGLSPAPPEHCLTPLSNKIETFGDDRDCHQQDLPPENEEGCLGGGSATK